MKAPSIGLNGTGVLAIAGVLVVGFLGWKVYRRGAQVVTKDLNPASSDNVVNQAVTAIGQAASGDTNWTLGGAVYDATHTDPVTGQGPWDRYKSWVSGFWGGTPAPASTPSSGDFARLDRLGGTQAQYQRPPATSNSQAGDPGGPTPLSFYPAGASFKDLADPLSVNPFRSLEPVPLGQVTV